MNKQSLLAILTVFMSVFIFTQCNGTKKAFQKTPPFSISKAYYQDWVGGIPGKSGTSVHINLGTLEEGVIPDSLFFRQSKAKVGSENTEIGHLWVANFNSNLDQQRDISMHVEPEEEYGNKAPVMESIPFELADGEAVISYYTKDKLNYFKLSDLRKKETIYYPAAPPRN